MKEYFKVSSESLPSDYIDTKENVIENLLELIQGEDLFTVAFERIFMTEQEYESLPEFEGC